MSKTFSLWCVEDGKPGHVNQLRGVVAGLGKHTGLSICWIHAAKPWREQVLNSPKPDLILCAGHRTHWRALYLKWRFRAATVVLMKPSLPRCFFDLCLIPEHDRVPAGRRVVLTRGMLNSVESVEADKQVGLVLIGGPSKHYDWSDTDMLRQLNQLFAALPDVSWTLTTSRRTPSSFVILLKVLPNAVKVVPIEATDSDWLKQRYRDCGTIWVSEDSASMVYESLSSGADVGVLPVPRKTVSHVSEGIDGLLAEGYLSSLVALQNDSVKLPKKPPLREADRIGEYLFNWLQAKTLGSSK